MNKPDLALNSLQWLICHQTKPVVIPKLKSPVCPIYS